MAAVAARQYGLVTRDQLRELGLGPTGIGARIRTRRLHRLHRGVYSVGHNVLLEQAYWLAAVLACGRGAVLSHLSAAALWEIRGDPGAHVHLTVPSQAGRARRPRIRIHRSRRLAPEDVTIHEGIPVTTVARTLLDLADVLSKQALKRAIDESEYRRLFDLTAVVAAVGRNPNRRSRKLVALAAGPAELTRSPLEDRFLAIVQRHGLPRPQVNHQVAGYQVDFYWPHAKLVVELDGFAAHGTRRAFQSDRERDRRLTLAGLTPIRLTAQDLRNERALADELRSLVRSSAAR